MKLRWLLVSTILLLLPLPSSALTCLQLQTSANLIDLIAEPESPLLTGSIVHLGRYKLRLLELFTASKRSQVYAAEIVEPPRPGYFALKTMALPEETGHIAVYNKLDFENRRGHKHIEDSGLNSKLLFPAEAILSGDRMYYLSRWAKDSLTNQIADVALGDPTNRQDNAIELAHEVLGDILEELSLFASAGLSHNDIKPENILRDLGRFGLIDFDLVTKFLENPTTFTDLFASPELVKRQCPDTVSDLYSLGVTLLQILANSQGFRFEKERSDSGVLRQKDIDGFLRSQEEFLQSYVVNARVFAKWRELKSFIQAATIESRQERWSALTRLKSSGNIGGQVIQIMQKATGFHRAAAEAASACGVP